MKRSQNRHLGVLGGFFLLVALIMALAVPGMASAKQRIPGSGFTPDSSAPVTTDNSASYAGSAFTLVFTAVDSGSGVAATYYSIDGGSFTEGSTVNIVRAVNHKRAGLTAGLHTIQYYSVDVSDNVEPVRSCTITI